MKKQSKQSFQRTQLFVAALTRKFEEAGDPERAAAMAAYMKTTMPFYGVSAPVRTEILRTLFEQFPIESVAECADRALAVWQRPTREEKYAALRILDYRAKFVVLEQLPLYEQFVREGQWWDLVDDLATGVIATLCKKHPAAVLPVFDEWIGDSDFWIRRAAILGQMRRKSETDTERLFRYCLQCAHEKEFFIRKAIGWALRDFSRWEPDLVEEFVLTNRDKFSGLTVREALKNLEKVRAKNAGLKR